MISGLLIDKDAKHGKLKGHKDKIDHFLREFPDAVSYDITEENLVLGKKLWEESRYHLREIVPDEVGYVSSQNNRIYEFGREYFKTKQNLSRWQIDEKLETVIHSELKGVDIESVGKYLRNRELNLDYEASVSHIPQPFLMVQDVAAYSHLLVQTDHSEVAKFLTSCQELDSEIVKIYDSFIRILEKIVEYRLKSRLGEDYISELRSLSDEEKIRILIESMDHNLLVGLSFLGYSVEENITNIKAIYQALQEGRVGYEEPKVTRESNPRITEYKAKIVKQDSE